MKTYGRKLDTNEQTNAISMSFDGQKLKKPWDPLGLMDWPWPATSKSRVALNFSPELLFYLGDMIIW
jgi:hypothetical protein